MKVLLPLLVLIITPQLSMAADSVTVPWEEFKKLYHESLEREVAKQMAWLADREEPSTSTINEARYTLRVAGDMAQGDVRVAGKLLAGPPRPIPLFGEGMIVSHVGESVGGDLLGAETSAGKIRFLPHRDVKDFQLALSFLARVEEDGAARAVSFEIPGAVKSVLQLELPAGARLLEAPGIAGAAGEYHFSPRSVLRIRFLTKESLEATLVQVDAFSRIYIKEKQAVVTTTLLPMQPLARPITLRVPEGARDVAFSLDASCMTEKAPGEWEIRRAPGQEGPFWARFVVEPSKDADDFAFLLPRIDKNNGSEGNFLIEEPADGQVRLTGEGVVPGIPVSSLAKELADAVGANRFYMRTEPGNDVRFHVARFEIASASPVVLDALRLCTSFEENGNSLSTLIMDIPAEAGSRLTLPLVPDSSIWSLSVNGEGRKVYVDSDKSWVIPLAADKPSHIELALLRKGAPLGLRGRLEAILPETNLSARKVCIVVALPERVQLLSIEGPVSPAPGDSWSPPGELMGKPYFFSSAFHKGGEMKLALSYKEPVKQTADGKEVSQ